MTLEDLTLKQKILIGAGLVAIGLLGAYGLYYFLLKPAPKAPTLGVEPTPSVVERPSRPGLPSAQTGTPGTPITQAPGTTPETGTGAPQAGAPTLPSEIISPIATGGLTEVTTLVQAQVTAPTLAENGKDLAYYNRDDGKFYRITPDGNAVPLADQAFKDVESVAWAPDTSKAILEFPDGANILYDFDTKKQATLPKHWEDFAFSGTSDKIAFKSIGLDPEDRWLAVANPDGSGTVPVEPMGENGDKVTVHWSPNQSMIATFTESRDGRRQNLFFVGQNGENFKLAVLEGRQFSGKWTPDGDRMLYSVYSSLSDYKPSLWIVDAAPGTSGENREQLGLQTWADKCTIARDNTTAYCAVPKVLPEGAGIVREVAKDIADDFYRVDLKTGTKTFIASPAGEDITAQNLALSQDGQNLFFTDTKTGTLKKMQLK
ncbi:MAG: hypothetical protein Q7S16_05480 [bacterium]|nr:hypothetical protein [bacterium]